MKIESKILVVRTNRKAAESLAEILREGGLQSLIVGTPDEALCEMRKRPYDMVIADCEINGTSGFDFCTLLREEFPMTQRVLLQSATLDVGVLLIVNQSGPCKILKDPVDPDEIWRLLALEGPLAHTFVSTDATKQTLELEKERRVKAELLKENALLQREISRLQNKLPLTHPRTIRKTPLQIAPLAKLTPMVQQKSQDPLGTVFPDEAIHKSTRNPNYKSIPAPGEYHDNPQETARNATINKIGKAMDILILEREILLPVFPPIGREIHKLTSEETATLTDLVVRISQEQSISARLLQVANSPIYAGLERTRNLQQAISRLGMRETRNVVSVILSENMFKTQNKLLVKTMTRLWMHSLCVAYCNEHIAKELRLPQSDEYFVAGLLHDIGKLVIIHLLDIAMKRGEINAKLINEDILMSLMKEYHNEFGVRLFKKWKYSDFFIQIAAFHNEAMHIQDRLEVVVITYFSNLLSRKVGYSLVPHDEVLLNREELADALNMSSTMRQKLEGDLKQIIEKVQHSFFGVPVAG